MLGDFDRLVVTFHLERDAVYFMAQHFLPLNLNIILSMTTFWIDYKCVKARVTIPLVVVLTLTKQTMALKAVLPFSSEPVSLEYYLNFSIFFVFMVLLEYCMVELSKIKEIRVSTCGWTMIFVIIQIHQKLDRIFFFTEI